MNPRIIEQGDPRWASLPYPKDPYTVKSDGCGLCAVTNCAIEKTNYWYYTPKDTISFMRKYAVAGNGTSWAGIDEGLDKYIGNHKRHYDMTSFFNEVKKGSRVGVILFGNAVSPDGTQWTKSGHYVCFVDWKYENGQNWLFCKDSSYRKLSGWKSYEKSMRGCIPDVLWTAEVNREGWIKDGDKWLFHDKNGTTVKDKWIKWKNEWYYLKPDGYMAANEWAKDSKGWMYMGKDGKMLKGRWLRWKNNMYHLKSDGYMQTGSANLPCKFDESGKLIP